MAAGWQAVSALRIVLMEVFQRVADGVDVPVDHLAAGEALELAGSSDLSPY